MKATLIFSPFALPRIPLGIATLKALAELGGRHTVKCFDFNAIFHALMIDHVQKEGGKIETSAEDKKKFLNALSSLAAPYNINTDLNLLNEAAMTVRWGFDPLYIMYHDRCTSAVQDGGAPPWFMDAVIKIILSTSPGVVGFSVMFNEQFYFSALAAKMIKETSPSTKIVFGGAISTALIEDTLSHPYIDFVISSEGEEAFLQLLNALESKESLDEIPNLAFRSRNTIRKNKEAAISDLNSIPHPDFSDLDLKAYLTPTPVIPILASRGCPWRKCRFCTHYQSYFMGYRVHDVQYVVDELERHVKKGINNFCFVDEMLLPKRLRDIGSEIIRRGLKLNFYAMAKPTADFTRETFEIANASGCRYIIWGMESGCQRVLDKINKGTHSDDIPKVFTDAAAAGIKNHVFVIIGFPTEQKGELAETLTLLYRNRESIHAVHQGPFILHKGSYVYDHPESFSITKIHSTQGAFEVVPYEVSEGLSMEEADRLHLDIVEKFSNHFSPIENVISYYRDHTLLLYSNPTKDLIDWGGRAIIDPQDLVI